MANGIPLAQRQRSALLQSLLQQQQQTRPVTGIGAIGQLARQFAVRQIINREEQRQKQAEQVAQQQRNTLAQALTGRTAAEKPPTEGREAILAALVRSGSPEARAILPQAAAAFFKEPEQRGGFLEGTNLEAQSLNILQRVQRGELAPDSFEAEAAKQVLSRERTTVTPQGTFVQPGLDVGILLGGESTQRRSSVEQFFPREPTERERTAGLVSRNLVRLESNVTGVMERNPGFDPSALAEARGNTPLIGNIIASPAFRQYRSQAEQWVANTVFLRSGVTARQEEVDRDFRNLWPQPGDDVETQKLKEITRKQTAIEALLLGERENRIRKTDAEKQRSQLEKDITRLQGELTELSQQRRNQPETVEGIDAAIQQIDEQLRQLRGNGS